HVEVSDTGIGMDEATRRRCLEPFFTTKGDRGSGLGLAMVYGMVQRHSAELQIDSEPGRGSTFRLVFPEADQDQEGTVRMPAIAVVKRLRILLVDDDPMLIKSMDDILQADGHAVTVAGGGQAGIDAFAASVKAGTPFALVITDLGMPHVDGRRVAAAVKAASPTTPVIMLTGWGQRLVAENDIPPHVNRVLNKPPRLNELRQALAELSAARDSSGRSDESREALA
ncbi:MAG TPA: response regulator, partial [Steroidobacteraceae bacterium]|nr:response regulator [Steroidobacteraceae bacterium]